jgi:cell division protein FtsB
VKGALALALVLLLAGAALMGGTYSTVDYVRIRNQKQKAQDQIQQLRREVDSLARYDRALRTDPDTLERVARESFGMIKPGEHLYQVVRPDSTH